VRPRHRGREDQASRPTAKGGWDLDLGLIRDDLAEEDVVALECPFPRLAARLTAKPGPAYDSHGVQSPHPAKVVENPGHGVQPLHPAPGTGCKLHEIHQHLASGPVAAHDLPGTGSAVPNAQARGDHQAE
jgi:hypothetical protein